MAVSIHSSHIDVCAIYINEFFFQQRLDLKTKRANIPPQPRVRFSLWEYCSWVYTSVKAHTHQARRKLCLSVLLSQNNC